jgi:hypothetical protein
VLLSVAPNGKLAFIATESTAIKFTKLLYQTARSVGVTLVTYTFDDYKTSTENASELFSLPDDVRAVIFCDREVSDLAGYFASIKNLPLIIFPQSIDANGLIRNKIYITTGDKIDAVLLKVKRHVIIDKKIILDDYADAYAFIMSRFISLIDYRINLSVQGGTPHKTAFDVIKNCVLSTFGSPKLKSGLKDVLLYNSFATEMAIASTNGDINDLSAENVGSNLLGQKYNSKTSLYIASILIEIYNSLCKIEPEFCALTNVNDVADQLELKLGIVSTYFLDALSYQIAKLTKNSDRVKAQMQLLTKEIKSYYGLSKTIYSAYLSLGGSEIEPIDHAFAITHAGDVGKFINGISLVRESGFIK